MPHQMGRPSDDEARQPVALKLKPKGTQLTDYLRSGDTAGILNHYSARVHVRSVPSRLKEIISARFDGLMEDS